VELPEALRLAIADLAERQPHQALARAAARLSEGYRVAGGDTASAADSAASVAAYAVTRLPATFAALTAALSEARALLPNWAPVSLLDVGAGPGVAVWAANVIWPTLQRATLIERDQRMIATGRELLDAAPTPLDITWRQQDMTGAWGQPALASADLVTCAYALNEIPEPQRGALVARLWEAAATAKGALALVAPGTPAGFAAIRAARDQLITAGANILAPCPHARACPMTNGDWCHFAQRLARSRLHRQLKGGDAPYEDEKFAYLIVARQDVRPASSRVIRRPTVLSGHIQLTLCATNGLERRDITRSQKAAFRQARDAYWGAPWESTAIPPEP
jgi:ribosomal protein RSM22 (predicted rRNA methylase)